MQICNTAAASSVGVESLACADAKPVPAFEELPLGCCLGTTAIKLPMQQLLHISVLSL